MVTASTLKSPILLAFIITSGIAVNISIIGLFALAAYRDGQVADTVVTTFTGLLGIAFGAAGPIVTHMIYSLSGVPQPGVSGEGRVSTETTIRSSSGGSGAASDGQPPA
jgi:hypothetical protein